jgi:hypothetical protein
MQFRNLNRLNMHSIFWIAVQVQSREYAKQPEQYALLFSVDFVLDSRSQLQKLKISTRNLCTFCTTITHHEREHQEHCRRRPSEYFSDASDSDLRSNI